MSKSSVLQQPIGPSFDNFIKNCQAMGLNHHIISEVAQASLHHLHGSRKQRKITVLTRNLEQQWYSSLANGGPDYGIYGMDEYIGELWACWVIYSRKYLRGISSTNSLPDGRILINDMENVRGIADLGCGIGYTTAALSQLFPQAAVIGTNLEGIAQTRIAQKVGSIYDFGVVGTVDDITIPIDLVFASEYFEHIYEPIGHLIEVIEKLRPRYLLIANTFNSPSVGHFPHYLVNGVTYDGRSTSKLFNNELRQGGYIKADTKLWNSRPTYWKLAVTRPL